jgi:hypothetical protein
MWPAAGFEPDIEVWVEKIKALEKVAQLWGYAT